MSKTHTLQEACCREQIVGIVMTFGPVVLLIKDYYDGLENVSA